MFGGGGGGQLRYGPCRTRKGKVRCLTGVTGPGVFSPCAGNCCIGDHAGYGHAGLTGHTAPAVPSAWCIHVTITLYPKHGAAGNWLT